MKTTRRFLLFLLTTAWAILLAGCASGDTVEGECVNDNDCGSEHRRCDGSTHRCICKSDEACATGEECNPSGSCQKKIGCHSNTDCKEGLVCDIGTGSCMESGKCTADFHCDIGQICQDGACRPGCRDTADCDLLKREVCLSGTCRFDLCENNGYCPFGQICNQATHKCVDAPEIFCQGGCSPICEGCTDITKGPCDHPANLCVEEFQDGRTFCWVQCQTQEDCPSGHACVATTVEWSPDCRSDLDCTQGGDPVVNICQSTSQRCKLNNQPCQRYEDCYQFDTKCHYLGERGYCVFGYHCRPSGGCISHY